jgi:predicted transcriptional regulator
MDTLIIGNQSEREIRERIVRSWKTEKAEKAARLDFVNLDDAWKILSDKRRAILQVMVGQGELTIREIARRVERDVRAVHSDVHVLLRCGVIDRTDDGRVVLPFKTIKFDFTFEALNAA